MRTTSVTCNNNRNWRAPGTEFDISSRSRQVPIWHLKFFWYQIGVRFSTPQIHAKSFHFGFVILSSLRGQLDIKNLARFRPALGSHLTSNQIQGVQCHANTMNGITCILNIKNTLQLLFLLCNVVLQVWKIHQFELLRQFPHVSFRVSHGAMQVYHFTTTKPVMYKLISRDMRS